MAKIFVSRKIPGDFIERLKVDGNEVEVSDFNRPLTNAELVEKVKELMRFYVFLQTELTET